VQRPPLVTIVGIIAIVAGMFPLVELTAGAASPRFAAWFLPLVTSMIPLRPSLAIVLVFVIGIVDIALGIGVLAGKTLALYGMVLRSFVAVPFDYLTWRAGSPVGALIGLTVNVFIVWALLRSASRHWFVASR
jgi:hypothetical protein